MNKFEVGDIAVYDDMLEDTTVISTHFIITKIDKILYHVMCLEDDTDPNESYAITWINDSPKWKKVS